MHVLAEREGKIYGVVTIDGPGDFAPPFYGALFSCLIWDHEGSLMDEQRFAIARALLESGCRSVVCGGEKSEAWHDAVDLEFVQRHLEDAPEVSEAMHVMTTWHDGESADDVARRGEWVR